MQELILISGEGQSLSPWLLHAIHHPLTLVNLDLNITNLDWSVLCLMSLWLYDWSVLCLMTLWLMCPLSYDSMTGVSSEILCLRHHHNNGSGPKSLSGWEASIFRLVLGINLWCQRLPLYFQRDIWHLTLFNQVLKFHLAQACIR